MEIYIQWATVPRSKEKRDHILDGTVTFPWVLRLAEKLAQAKVPENVRYMVYPHEAAEIKPRAENGGNHAGPNGFSHGHMHSSASTRQPGRKRRS